MWVDILSMAAIGVLVACAIFIVRRVLKLRGQRIPRWAMPALIGAGMIGYSIWNEYSWFDRITSQLPTTVAVVGQGQRSDFWAPWTYLWPVTTRFMAMDMQNRVASRQLPGLVVTELLLVERWQATRKVHLAFDCHERRRADLFGQARIEADGTLSGAKWQPVAPDDPLLRAACAARVT